ncbi:MAG: GH3 auxin-responsive promoter family protein [Bacteroidota bacterium]
MVFGAIIKQGLRLGTKVKLRTISPARQQARELRRLLSKARDTSFGRQYGFDRILSSSDMTATFQESVPFHNYNSMHDGWWNRCLQEEENVCWPGYVKYFALSSGTSESASKHIPVTRDMIKSLKKASIRQIVTLGKYDLPAEFFEKGILWLGGSTDLQKQGGYYEGDVSGISARRVPIWFQRYYKPGKKLRKEKDWNQKLEEITRQAKDWDIGIITGVPSWVQLLFEKIIDRYGVKSIHEIWPNLRIYLHGGVSFEPYRRAFDRFFTNKVHYIEVYPASEGFIAFQSEPDVHHMKMILNNGIFYEFVPFDEKHFDGNGEIRTDAVALTIDQVKTGTDYAILLSTCAGAWRYLIGDTIRFTDVEKAKIVITGRTKHFLSLVGEHLSVDNMNRAVDRLSDEFGVELSEFCVAGVPSEGSFAHHWYIGINHNTVPDKTALSKRLDEILKELNDDYAVERGSALKDPQLDIVPVERFYAFMTTKGKMGGQNKFPRVMKATQFEEWKSFQSQG